MIRINASVNSCLKINGKTIKSNTVANEFFRQLKDSLINGADIGKINAIRLAYDNGVIDIFDFTVNTECVDNDCKITIQTQYTPNTNIHVYSVTVYVYTAEDIEYKLTVFNIDYDMDSSMVYNIEIYIQFNAPEPIFGMLYDIMRRLANMVSKSHINIDRMSVRYNETDIKVITNMVVKQYYCSDQIYNPPCKYIIVFRDEEWTEYNYTKFIMWSKSIVNVVLFYSGTKYSDDVLEVGVEIVFDRG